VLNGRLAAGFHHILKDMYRDGRLHRMTKTDNGKGGVTSTPCDLPCKVQVDRAGKLVQVQGYVEGDAGIIILAYGLDTVKDDDELTVDQETWRLIGPELDAAKSHWRCRGRKRNHNLGVV